MAREFIGPTRHPLCACPERREFPYGIDYSRDCRWARIAHPRLVGVEEMNRLLAGVTRTATSETRQVLA